MRLELWRDVPNIGTFGNLYSDGMWQMFSLEPLNPIPAGEYNVTMHFWEKKHKFFPLLDVPGHTGIYIHGGWNVHDTTNCILVGLRKGDDYILDSQKALELIKIKIASGLELGKVSIKVFDPPQVFGDI